MVTLPMNLCAICQRLDIQQLLLAAASSSPFKSNGQGSSQKPTTHAAVPTFFSHQSNLTLLKLASDTCHLCSAIWKDFCRQHGASELTEAALTQGLGNEQIFIGTLDWDSSINAVPSVVVRQQTLNAVVQRSRQLACFEVCADRDTLPLENEHLLARLQASSADDGKCFDVARAWLQDCRENHPACQSAYSPSLRMPTRLLDVGHASDHRQPDTGKVRLVDCQHCKGPYAALSYCWGDDRDLILTHDSQGRLAAGIDATKFPGTLRDAITVTRQLGVRYLWIDALCIFQDQERAESKADWAREAGRMRDVYRGAVITIEAASASHGNEGFLKSRMSSRPYCALQWGHTPGRMVYLRPMFDITDTQLIGTTVYTRGWTLQERLLAPRTLSFGLQQCSFECANGFVDEAGRSTQLPRATESYLSKRSMLQLRQDRGWFIVAWRALSRRFGLPAVVTLNDTYSIGWSSHGELDIPGGYWATYFDYWRGIVTQFSQRQLTNNADKLPALSGLADEVQRATGSVYVAGMWRDELVISLAWSCGYLYTRADWSGEEEEARTIPAGSRVTYADWRKTKRQTDFVAPSWSWASVKGVISFPVKSYQEKWPVVEEIAEVTHVQVSPKYTTDPLGGLKHGALTLRTLFLPIPNPLEPCSPKHYIAQYHTQVRTDEIRLTNNVISEFYQHHQPYEGQTFALLQLLSTRRMLRRGSTTSVQMLYMLLVESCEEGGYRRLCCLRLSIDTLAQLKEEHFGHWLIAGHSDLEYKADMQPELERMAAMSREVREAPWERRTIRLV